MSNKSPKDLRKQIREISLVAIGDIYRVVGVEPPQAKWGLTDDQLDKIMAAITSHMQAGFEAVIGIDELELSPDGSKQYQGRMSRNSLRRKQRQRAAEWLLKNGGKQ